MAALIYQQNKILGQIPINWENLWSYYIRWKCKSQVTQIIKEERSFLSKGVTFGTKNWICTHAYSKMRGNDPFLDNIQVCWGGVEDNNSVILTSAIFVCQYEDWCHDSSLWATSEHLNVLYWLVQVRSANINLPWGQWCVNQGLFCF